MSSFYVFSTSVKYKYKAKIFSLCTVIIFILTCISIIAPLIIAFEAGGFWLRTRIYVEKPKIQFIHKYLLISERDIGVTPIVCSTFTIYQNNPIKDDCSTVKIHQVDIDRDGQNDVLKFLFQFYSTLPIKTCKLVLFFQFEFKDTVNKIINSSAIVDYIIPYESQKIHILGDLKFNQKSPIKVHDNHELLLYNERAAAAAAADDDDDDDDDLTNNSLVKVLTRNAKKKFSAQIINTQVIWQAGFSNDESIIISGEIAYLEQLLQYQPSLWEELKWAWIQYLSLFIALSYCIQKFFKFLLTKCYLQAGYIVIPWKEE